MSGLSSEMKSGGECSYWDAKLFDEGGSRRVFGFDRNVRRRLFDYQESGDTIDLVSCVVKKARHSDDRDSGEQVEVSTVKVDPDVVKVTKAVNVGKIDDLRLQKRYDVYVKVLSVGSEEVVGSGLKKQDLIVGDQSGSARLTLWQSEIGTMQAGCSYTVSGVMVRKYRRQRFLSTSKQGTSINKATPLENVMEKEIVVPDAGNDKTVNNVHVVGVSILGSYLGCFKCRSKIIFDTDGLGECSKCNLFQAQGTAKQCTVAVLTVDLGDGNNMLELRAYDQVLASIAGTSTDLITAKSLIKAPGFDLTYYDHIIRSVHREGK